jgi:hypothetical protein
MFFLAKADTLDERVYRASATSQSSLRFCNICLSLPSLWEPSSTSVWVGAAGDVLQRVLSLGSTGEPEGEKKGGDESLRW